MKTALTEVKTFAELSALWTANTPAIKGLEIQLRQELVRAKDEAKARVQK